METLGKEQTNVWGGEEHRNESAIAHAQLFGSMTIATTRTTALWLIPGVGEAKHLSRSDWEAKVSKQGTIQSKIGKLVPLYIKLNKFCAFLKDFV